MPTVKLNASDLPKLKAIADQLVIPGCESDEEKIKTPELTTRVHSWLDAQEAQRRAALETKTIHALMIAELTLANVKRYPYLDRKTGTKRYVTVGAEPKARTIKAPTNKQQGKNAAKKERAAEKAKEKREADAENEVEHRKVTRTAEHDEIAKRGSVKLTVTHDGQTVDATEALDPFGKIRASLEGSAT